MNVPRSGHTATLLLNGEVLVAGGGLGRPLERELYNPSAGSWTFTGSMTTPREGHQAVLLPSGEVLVAGGQNANGTTLASAELYNPSTAVWKATGSMTMARSDFSLTLLTDGKVLAVEGTSAELYNPSTGTWSRTGSPTSNVQGPNAALLPNSEVLTVPGLFGQLYNPSTGTWSAAGSTDATIISAITPWFSSGEVLAVGGFVSGRTAESAAALYNPSTGQFTPESGPCRCENFNGALLQTGEVLVAGGTIVVAGSQYPSFLTTNSAELWNPSTQAWTTTGSLNDSRTGESITVLQNGQALVAGASQSLTKNSSVVLATAELYTP